MIGVALTGVEVRGAVLVMGSSGGLGSHWCCSDGAAATGSSGGRYRICLVMGSGGYGGDKCCGDGRGDDGSGGRGSDGWL